MFKWHNVHSKGGGEVNVKSPDVATWCQNVTGHKCHSGPNIHWTFRAGQNVTRTFRRGTVWGFFFDGTLSEGTLCHRGCWSIEIRLLQESIHEWPGINDKAEFLKRALCLQCLCVPVLFTVYVLSTWRDQIGKLEIRQSTWRLLITANTEAACYSGHWDGLPQWTLRLLITVDTEAAYLSDTEAAYHSGHWGGLSQ
jgi:hypothetical protein